MRSFILLSLLFVNLLAASIDGDMDGVDNDVDQCPNTPFFELVDKTGCTTRKLSVKEEYHFDMMVGAGYIKTSNDTGDTLVSFMADYYYKKIIVTLFAQSYSQNNTYAENDLYLSVNYKWTMDNVTLKFGPGMVLPVASDSSNETDYFLNVDINYKIDKFDMNLYYKYTFMNDELARDIDTKAVSAGYYVSDKTYLNLAYSREKPIYSGIEEIENVAFMVNHTLNEHWFTNIRLSYGIGESASDLSAIAMLGYYF